MIGEEDFIICEDDAIDMIKKWEEAIGEYKRIVDIFKIFKVDKEGLNTKVD